MELETNLKRIFKNFSHAHVSRWKRGDVSQYRDTLYFINASSAYVRSNAWIHSLPRSRTLVSRPRTGRSARRTERYSLALGLGHRALVLRRREEANVRELPHRHLDLFHRPVAVVRYVHVHSNVLPVMVQLLVQRRLQVKLVRRHDEFFAHLDGRLLALLRRRVHDLPYREPHRVSATRVIYR